MVGPSVKSRGKKRIAELESEIRGIRQQLQTAEGRINRLLQETEDNSNTVEAAIHTLQAVRRPRGVTSNRFSALNEGADSSIHPWNFWQAGTPAVTLGEGSIPLSSWCAPVGGLADLSFGLGHPLLGELPPLWPGPGPISATLPRHSGYAPLLFDAEVEQYLPAGLARADGLVWAHMPKHSSPMSPMDKIILDLLAVHDQYHPLDVRSGEFTNTCFPSVNSLLNPSFDELERPVASAIARQLAGVVRVHNLPDKLALLYVIATLVRWQIVPSMETYSAIPDFVRPGLLQTVVPHPPWVDTIGWPNARNRIITHMDFSMYPEFARIITRTFSVNWPYGLNSIVQGDSKGDYFMNDTFIRHIGDVRNWTVGRELVERFPFLEGTINIRDQPG